MDPAVQRNGKPAVEPTIKPVVEANADPSVKANVDAAAAEGHAQATPVGFESGEIPNPSKIVSQMTRLNFWTVFLPCVVYVQY
ncbi:hypothetical protein N7534_005968 [Penicillium rubens]|nr:hypothetical protein N7534_005968 [Penicillium rubens]